MLETISVVLMEPPVSLEDNDFEKSKVEAMKKLYFKNEILTGQYKDYKEEINADSRTETFVELKLYSKAKRWKGVEIKLRTGKRLLKREAFIEIEFKKEPCMLYCNLGSAPNKLIIHIQPSDNIELTMNTTLPGEKINVTPVKMTFSPSNEFSANSSEGYEVILEECMLGNKRIFIGDKELDVAWKLTDKIAKFMKEITPTEYAHESYGPEWKKSF
jgi:glucose-6-phosphate 1-dehydrogenase